MLRSALHPRRDSDGIARLSSGLLGLVFELGGGFIGLLAGVALGPRIADATTDSAGLTGVMISLLTIFVLLTVGQTVGYIVGQRFASLAHKVRLGKLADGAWQACSRVWI